MRTKGMQRSIEDFSRALEQGYAAVYRRNFVSVTYEYMGGYIEEITGYAPEELTPEMWDSLVLHVEQKGELSGLSKEECFRMNRSGQVDRWQADMQIRTRSGQTRWVSDMSTVLRDESGDCFGTLGVLQDITERKDAEKKMADLAETLCLRNREIEADLALAREVQHALVSGQLKQFPLDVMNEKVRANFSHRYIPASTLAGDFFEILPLSEHEVGIFFCDVIGHGVRAALLTTFLRGLIEELVPQGDDPGALLGKINRSLKEVFGQSDSLLFATACYLVLDVSTGMIQFSNAGHPAPLCLQPANQVVAKLESPDQTPEPALGIVEGYAYTTQKYCLTAGEALLLYTDGVFEAYDANNEIYGEERLMAFIKQHLDLASELLMDELLHDVRCFSTSEDFEDDVCLLAVVPTAVA
ncbi:PP2C family protein-serine/threonine phosphatase [Pontiella sulfatireligans]|uniref:Phosphoserine phosphatase RsbP n=1 Tax=Pontiella sulfatireligans TaxID=2750658 RepID=A0A6C2UI34_9BACT|nr:PP2C family protein-serine/threonine phosphatase [Pontiella sulfatireligans]VGO19117.1 Phosphoserine phosphatase RsbP [Pontiella sulfatireligans]